MKREQGENVCPSDLSKKRKREATRKPILFPYYNVSISGLEGPETRNPIARWRGT